MVTGRLRSTFWHRGAERVWSTPLAPVQEKHFCSGLNRWLPLLPEIKGKNINKNIESNISMKYYNENARLLGWRGNNDSILEPFVHFTFETTVAKQTFTIWGASWRLSWYFGSWSLLTIHGWRRTWAAVNLLWGSTWSIFDTRSWGLKDYTLNTEIHYNYRTENSNTEI